MEFDETLVSMDLTEEEQKILYCLFVEKVKLRMVVADETIRSSQNICFDPTNQRVINPVDIVDFLRHNPNNYKTECSHHLGSLPDDLFKSAKRIWKNNEPVAVKVKWHKEGL